MRVSLFENNIRNIAHYDPLAIARELAIDVCSRIEKLDFDSIEEYLNLKVQILTNNNCAELMGLITKLNSFKDDAEKKTK